jgi:hypothetical protein
MNLADIISGFLAAGLLQMRGVSGQEGKPALIRSSSCPRVLNMFGFKPLYSSVDTPLINFVRLEMVVLD